MRRITWKYRCECLVLLVVAAIVRPLPRAWALALGSGIGRLAAHLFRNRRQLALDNLRRALPECSETEIAALVRQNFRHMGVSGVEMLRLDLWSAAEGDLERDFVIEDLSHLYDALAQKRGVIVLTAHLGFWEIGQFVLPALGVPFDVVAKPLKNPLVDRYLRDIRQAFGARVLDSRKGARRILQSLRAGRAVGILLDQHISPPGAVATEFFGRPAYTTTAIASMAMKHRIPVVPVFCLRRADGRYRIWSEPALHLESDGDDAAVRNTQLMTTRIEQAVRRDLSQWFWMHKRWRVRNKAQRGGKRQGTRSKD